VTPSFRKKASRILKELKNESKMIQEKLSSYSLRKRQKKMIGLARDIEALHKLAVIDVENEVVKNLEVMYSEQLATLVVDSL